MTFQQFPTPVEHPGFDSSKISPHQFSSPGRRQRRRPPTTTTNTAVIPNQNSSPLVVYSKNSSNSNVCDGYDGVLHIQSGDAGAATGTVFFIYIVNQLIYADKFNLLPWIHLTNRSKHIYDEHIHNTNTIITFKMMSGMTIDFISDGYHKFGFGTYAGPPKKLFENRSLEQYEFSVTGTGVWDHYFEPVSAFDFSCPDKPLLRMHYYHLTPGMLVYCPWSVRSWPYDGIAPHLAPKTTLQDWYQPMRQRGSEIVHKYFRFLPNIRQAAEKIVKDPSCLAMHIRYSDKAGTKRKRIPLENFLSYGEAYVRNGGKTIVLATDSTEVLTRIEKEWPSEVTGTIVRQSDDILRTSDRTPVFVAGSKSHDRTNREVLIDILAMSKCQFLVHGFSAVSEAVIYLNLELHKYSIDLEEHSLARRKTPTEFGRLVNETLRSRGIR